VSKYADKIATLGTPAVSAVFALEGRHVCVCISLPARDPSWPRNASV